MYQPTFHGGHYSHAFLSNGINPIEEPINWKKFNDKNIKTEYYTKKIHIGSFALPNWIPKKNKIKYELGVHLLIDITDGNFDKLNNVNNINAFLDKFIKMFHLKEIKRINNKFTPYGISIISMLSTSHCSIHTWPEKGSACLDLFSCAKDSEEILDFDLIKKILKLYFEVETIKINVQNRKY